MSAQHRFLPPPAPAKVPVWVIVSNTDDEGLQVTYLGVSESLTQKMEARFAVMISEVMNWKDEAVPAAIIKRYESWLQSDAFDGNEMAIYCLSVPLLELTRGGYKA